MIGMSSLEVTYAYIIPRLIARSLSIHLNLVEYAYT
jgi:hypothetical protein